MVESGLCFLASVSSGGGQFLVNGRCGFPFGIFLQKAPGVKARLVKPEEFALPAGRRLGFKHFVKNGQSVCSVSLFFETQRFLEKRLIPPVTWFIRFGGEAIVRLDRQAIIGRIGCGQFEVNVAFTTKRLAFFSRPGIAL